jgi:hypothetical protein
VSTQSERQYSLWSLQLAAGAALFIVACQTAAMGQIVVVRRPLWTIIDERLAYAQMWKTLAEAREINAHAVEQEIKNSVEYVKAYYEGRRIHDEEWHKKNPNWLESEKHRQKVLTDKVMTAYQAILNGGKGTKTDVLNWLLQELSNSVASLQYVFEGKSPLQPDTDIKLTARELHVILLTDGGSKRSQFKFSPDDGKMFASMRERNKWPPALRGHECDDARDKYKRAQDAVVRDLKEKHEITPESQKELMKAANGLFVALDDAYPRERRLDQAEFPDYSAGKVFIKSLLATANRAIAVDDPSIITNDLAFQGNSLFALLQYMHRNGLRFAEPQPGAEGVYDTMFKNLRTMYVSLAREQPAGKGQQGNGAEKE